MYVPKSVETLSYYALLPNDQRLPISHSSGSEIELISVSQQKRTIFFFFLQPAI